MAKQRFNPPDTPPVEEPTPIIDAPPLPNPQSESQKIKERRAARSLYQQVEVEVRDDGGPVLAAEEAVPLTDLTVPELKDLLRAAGLPVSGTKAELIDRLS